MIWISRRSQVRCLLHKNVRKAPLPHFDRDTWALEFWRLTPILQMASNVTEMEHRCTFFWLPMPPSFSDSESELVHYTIISWLEGQNFMHLSYTWLLLLIAGEAFTYYLEWMITQDWKLDFFCEIWLTQTLCKFKLYNMLFCYIYILQYSYHYSIS